VGGVRDTILETEQVLVVPSNNVELYFKALLQQVENKLHQKHINAAENRQFVAEKFGLQQMVTNIKQLYDELLN